ncbi:MAG: hypothetical protein JNL67_11715 [Planctomycetaceae bacterium]|nr:hypothetical protein [Planctomycetaceae bacterium]
MRLNLLLMGLLLAATVNGCGTTAQRGAMEQLLVSDAIDQAVGQIDFSPLRDKDVYLDAEYIRTVKPLGFVNADYVLSSLRHQILAAGCHLKDRRDDAEIIIEPRVGSLGTDDYNIVYGLPRSEAASMLGAASNTGISIPLIPELAVGKSEYRQGFAKLNIFAYRADDRAAVWQSGVARSTATSRDTWVMGIGPFQKGSIYRDRQIGGFNRLANIWAANATHNAIPPYLVSQTYPNNKPVEIVAKASDQTDEAQNTTGGSIQDSETNNGNSSPPQSVPVQRR